MARRNGNGKATPSAPPPRQAAGRTASARDYAASARTLARALAEAEARAHRAESGRERAVARATSELQRENEALEAQLTRLLQEMALVKHVVARVEHIERESRVKALRIAELEDEVARLRNALTSGRATAIAAAAASQAARMSRPH